MLYMDMELAKMMEIIVEVYRSFVLRVSAKKTKTMCLPPRRINHGWMMMRVEAVRQTYTQFS